MASTAEIAVEMERLANALPPPRGIKPDKAFESYAEALTIFSAVHVHEAITRFFQGEFADISAKFYPRAPELASICRKVQAEHGSDLEREARAFRLKREREEAAAAEQLRIHTPEQKARVAALYRGYLDATVKGERERIAAERAEMRARYGMTDELLAQIPDRPLPRGMVQAGEALPKVEMLEDEALTW